ncbi:MAG: AAA family ATPase [Candidatus Saccharimonadales bacterium]
MKESLYVVRGPIGVGKSSVTKAIHARMAGHASIVETDAIKRMIDPSASSEWRRKVASASAAYIIEQLLQVPRSGIIETHTKYPAELDRLAAVAARNDARLVNVLLTAPLEVCQARAAQRDVPGITYAIDQAMVANYYCNLDPRPDDLVFNTADMSSQEIAATIASRLA